MYITGITKGVEFSVVTNFEDTIGLSPNAQGDLTRSLGRMTIKISKDGGAYVDAVNDATFILKGSFSLTLTAEEMNADKIELVTKQSYGGREGVLALTILTGSSSGATPQQVWEYSERTVNGGFLWK